MTVSTFYPETSDGFLISAHATTYSTARAGTGTVSKASSGLRFGDDYDITPMYNCHESFLNFDTSAIPDSDTITEAVLSIYGKAESNYGAIIVQARLHDWGDTLEIADWVPGADLSAKTLLSTFTVTTYTDWNLSAYNAFTSESTFVSNVSKTGFTRMLISCNLLAAGTTPTVNTHVDGHDVEQGTVYRPKLVVTHSASGPAAPTLSASQVASDIVVTWT